MKKMILPFVLLSLTLLAWVASGFYFYPQIQASPNQPTWNKPAPVFQLPDLEHDDKTFDSRVLKGEVYLLNFWASWCVSCKQEHPLLLKLAEQKRARLYSVNYRDQRQAARQTLMHNGNPYLATGFDPQGLTTQSYGIVGTPITVVIDKAGIVRYKHLGPINEAVFEQIIAPLLRELEKA